MVSRAIVQNLDALSVSRETLERIERYIALLDEWRQRMNLIGPKEMDQIWERHVHDLSLIHI